MKFKPVITKAIIKAISEGVPKKYAAQGCGINESTLYKWLEEGETDFNNNLNTEKSEFYKSIKKAESEAVRAYLDIIKEAAKDKSWQAAAWWLERTRPKDFGRKHEISGSEEKPFSVILHIDPGFIPDGIIKKDN